MAPNHPPETVFKAMVDEAERDVESLKVCSYFRSMRSEFIQYLHLKY